jgi:pyruvate, water dikinase
MGEQIIRWFGHLTNDDVDSVGGKNASLGEMTTALREAGVRVPDGFATTAQAYRSFLDHNDLESFLDNQGDALKRDERPLDEVGSTIRRRMRHGEFPAAVADGIREAYAELCRRAGSDDLAVAVRSSATAEDLPDASFAGQQETYLNVTGDDDLLDACRRCYASLFTDRAISYRREQGFDHRKVALSVGVQPMVRSESACAGVMFSLDTDTGFPDVVVINGSWGLGESVVAGAVDPDEYRVFKPRLHEDGLTPILAKVVGAKKRKVVYASGGNQTTKTVSTSTKEQQRLVLSDGEILTLARWAVAIEGHYGRPMDMEWAKDGETGDLYCVQARPETVHSQRAGASLTTYRLGERSEVLATGIAVGQAVGQGTARVLDGPDQSERFADGDVLVTERTDPDWGPIMARASAVVTDSGGRTSHAAIVSRELGVPAVIGTTTGTTSIEDGRDVTVSCAEGSEGRVYDGRLTVERRDHDLDDLPESPVRLMVNLATPDAALRWWRLPVDGVGLARMEFILNDAIAVHPLALTRSTRWRTTRHVRISTGSRPATTTRRSTSWTTWRAASPPSPPPATPTR